MEIDIIPLAGYRYLIEVEDRGDELGPLTKAELVAIRDALEDFLEEF
jgi:hypothetical protein